MLRYITTIAVLFMTGTVLGGDFTIAHDGGELIVDYTGGVDMDDFEDLSDLMKKANGRTVYLFINSPGGSAYGGVYLFWEAAKHDNLVTIAGADLGTWSAAALFWSGGQKRVVELGGIVGFHHAYCNPYNPPGCDTSEIDRLIFECYEYAFGLERATNLWHVLSSMRDMHGVGGWVGLINIRGFETAWYMFTTRGSFVAPWDGTC